MTECCFIDEKEMTAEELFKDSDGNNYTSLLAVTYSADLNFINQIIKNIDYAEIIFGNKKVLNKTTTEVLIAQTADCDYINKKMSQYDLERIKKGTLKFFITNGVVSHDKFYLLSNESSTKVITGSANFSTRAFKSPQKEGIYIDKSKQGYDLFLERFNNYKDFCSSEIDIKIFNGKELKDEDILRNIPVIKQIDNLVVIKSVEDSIEDSEQIEDMEYSSLAEKWERKIIKSRSTISEKPKTVLAPNNITKLCSNFIKNEIEEKEILKEHPRLVLNYDTKSATFNDKKLNLNPEKQAILKDVNLYLDYMSGFDVFFGDVKKNKETYFKLAAWMFASPFLPFLRYQAHKCGSKVIRFPVFGFVYGESDGGKTNYANLITKMMSGVEIVETPAKGNFTKKNIDFLRELNKGLPIVLDDIGYSQYNSNMNLVKNESFSIRNKQNCYPSIVLTSNDIDSLKPEYVKRVIPFRISIQNNKNKTEMNYTKLAYIKKRMTNSFYCEYIRKMFERIDQIVDKMEENLDIIAQGRENPLYLPDIFKVSSEIIIEILNSVGVEIPSYMRVFTYDDYFGDSIIAEKSIEVLKETYKTMPSSFKVNRKENLLTYTSFCEATHSYEKDNDILFNYINELPRELKIKQNNRTLTFDLKETEKLLNMRFSNNSLFNKIFNKI